MAKAPAGHFGSRTQPADCAMGKNAPLLRSNWMLATLAILLMVLFASISFAQSTPRVTSVDPAEGKVNDSVTVVGQNLGKGSVAGVFLSDDKNDYKASLLDQSAGKIVIKIPQVKPGGYNVSIQVGAQIYIEPVRFTVQG
jgi:IPT/TIG domain